jgi:hypothetical protein
MTAGYEVVMLTEEERERLQRAYDDLMALSACQVPSVRAAARSALAFVAQALNGQGLQYELYTASLKD